MPLMEECRKCHLINPEFKHCNPDETDEYYSDDYCVFNNFGDGEDFEEE